MNHLNNIAAKLPDYGLDAMLITSEPGERYAVGFLGEGFTLAWPFSCARPFPLPALFCLARVAELEGERYVLFRFGRDGWPGPPEGTGVC